MYHVPWIALISAKRWRLYVLTFLIHGFTRNDFRLSEQWVFYFWKCFHDCNLVMSSQITIFFLLSIRHQFFLVCKVTLLIYEKVSFAYQLFSCAQWGTKKGPFSCVKGKRSLEDQTFLESHSKGRFMEMIRIFFQGYQTINFYLIKEF